MKGRFICLAVLAVSACVAFGETQFLQRSVRGVPRDAQPLGSGEGWAASFGKDHISYWWNRYCKTHPEFFARRSDGKRLPWGAPDNAADIDLMKQWGKDRKMWNCLKSPTLCVTAEGLVDAIVDDWVKDGKPAVIGCADSVRRFVCTCDKCKALDEPKPADGNDEEPDWYADRYVNLANRVLVAARKFRPDVRVAMRSSFQTLRPPRREKLADGVFPVLTPTFFSDAYLDAYLAGWKKAGMKSFYLSSSIRNYFESSPYPVANEVIYYHVAKKMADAGCVGADFIGGKPADAFAEHADRILAAFLADPSLSFDELERRDCARFGKGAQEAEAYFRFFRKLRDARLGPIVAKVYAHGEIHVGQEIVAHPGALFKASDFEEAAKLLTSPEVNVLRDANAAALAAYIEADPEAAKAATAKRAASAGSAAGAQWRGRKVAFLGDSISAGVGTKKGYWKFVEESLGVEQHVYAVSGHQWSDMMARIADMKKELGADIDAIVVFIGTNDYGSGVPIGEWWTTNTIDTVFHGKAGKRIVRTLNEDVKTTRGAINVTLRYLKENWPDAQIVLTTPVHRGIFAKSWRPKDQHQPDELHSNMLGLFLEDYVRVNREAADIWSCPLVDFYRDGGIQPLVGSHGKYMNAPEWDRLHPNAAGHARMAALICSRLAALPVLRP